MRYMGGKFRQSKAIVQCLRPYINSNTVYVEPFCGAMWSACRVINELHPNQVILGDVCKPLILLWNKCIRDGVDWLPYKLDEIERNYPVYNKTRNDDDPLTAWYGSALSFGGKWFAGVARSKNRQSELHQIKRMQEKCDALNSTNTSIICCNYNNLSIPDSSVVYCDPPYEGRTKAHNFNKFDYNQFWEWVRQLSKRCVVFTSCFDCPDDFDVVYSWGDTVVRHLNSKGHDGTCEKLVKWRNY